MPSAQSCANTARAESALSVSPISTCLASLVTRGSASPASRAIVGRERGDLGEIVDARVAQPLLDGGEQPIDLRLRRVGPLRAAGSGRSCAGSAAATRCASRGPRAASRATVCSAARVSAASSSAASPARRASSRGPSASTSKSSDPRLSAISKPPGPGRARPELTVDVPDVRAAHDRDVDALGAQRLDDTCARHSRPAVRSATAVPSQSNITASKRRASDAGGSTVSVMFRSVPARHELDARSRGLRERSRRTSGPWRPAR